MKIYCLLLLLIGNSLDSFSQDFIRVGGAFDFQKNKVLQTFSLDLNRTEKVDEKVGKYIFFSSIFFLQPSSDINIGDGVTSSENNILFQANMGKIWTGDIHGSGGITQYVWNTSSEFNPSYNSDKDFSEKLYYVQLKRVWNFISQTFTGTTPPAHIKFVNSFALGPFVNVGSRSSRRFDNKHFYNTAGLILENKFRFLDSKHKEVWNIAISGNYYYVISDLTEVAKDEFGGLLKTSVNYRVYKSTFLGLSSKYGNDNPTYKYVSTLDLSIKIKY